MAAIAPQTVYRMLAHHTRKPWRQHLGRSPQGPREAAVAAQGHDIVTRYPRPMGVWAMGLCVDEHTRRQPRTRQAPTLAAPPGQPVRVAHEDPRTGALHLLAGVAPRTGKGSATTAERHRQGACIPLLEPVEREVAPASTTMHGGRDPLRMHKGKQVQAWLATQPRLVCPFPPVHGAWMNQGEPWCSLWQRQRVPIADCADKKHLAERLMALVAAWHEQAHPLRWSTKSVAKVMAKCDNPVAKAA